LFDEIGTQREHWLRRIRFGRETPMNKVLRNVFCGTGPSCPTIERSDEGGIEMIGEVVEDPTLPENEARIHWTESEARRIATEFVGSDIPDLGDYLGERHRADLLRVQTLEYYGVPSDDEDYLRYVNGDATPISPYREPWYRQLRDDRAAGKIWRNVHIVNLPLNDYLRYQFEWCYAYNVRAGMDVRILDTTAYPEAARFFTARDFYVIDGLEAVEMRYTEDGTYVGAVSAPSASTNPYATVAELAWAMATPFDQWWAKHPEFHRDGRMAA
jgi:hypothetical protein